MEGIQVLAPQEARRIAAGEVIDRPASLIREFLDNAIDAGSSQITVSIEGGGIQLAEVADDGSGMNSDDLGKCYLTHATSKIRCLDDLETAETLGFRGEALAAAAAVARLEIISSNGSGSASRLEVGPGESFLAKITTSNRTRGSTVRAINLYDTIPARKRFLKREGSEALQCRQVFIEKALAFPWITFRYNQDGRPKDFFPAASSKKERFASALLDPNEGRFLHEIHVTGGGFSADVVIGGPELFRSDRRMLYVFANGRRIQDYTLMLALEYGTQGWFPNGTHPIGAVYVDIDPALADFNIHPAKREVRFKDSGAIRHAISEGLLDFCRRHTITQTVHSGTTYQDTDLASKALFDTPPLPHSDRSQHSVFNIAQKMNAVNSLIAEESPVYDGSREIRYAGSVFGLFIIIEHGDVLYIIDQHAAHERILYNQFLAGNIPRQDLLVPITFTTDSSEEDRFLESKQEELSKLAVVIDKDADSWRIDTLPAGWRLSDSQTVKEILGLVHAQENMAERWAMTLCCHQAVRDGEMLDEADALNLAKETLALPDPHCPHGRPVWTIVSRQALLRAVRRNN